MIHRSLVPRRFLLVGALLVATAALSAADPGEHPNGVRLKQLDPGDTRPSGARDVNDQAAAPYGASDEEGDDYDADRDSDAARLAAVPGDAQSSAAAEALPGAVTDAVPAAIPAPTPPAPTAEELRVEERWPAEARAAGGIIADRQVIAYYGHPNSLRMGILGENPIEVMADQLFARAAEYDALTGGIGVAPAFHIIYATVHPDASVGIIREAQLLEYIEFAAQNDILVFLDHQIGNGTVEGAIRMMLPYLHYEHVHLAFDPEWATETPGQVIGGVTAEEINLAQRLMQEYLIEHGLPGPRMLVVHQFNWRMIVNRERVRADFPMVQLIHHADGFGTPPQKRDSWRFNVIAQNIPLKGFKLFYPKSWRDGGYDDPLMRPADVLQLDPVPVYIQYQ